MRWILFGIMVVVLATGAYLAVMHARADDRHEQSAISMTAGAIDRFEQELRFRGAMGEGRPNGRGFPTTVDRDWFNGDVPRNAMLPPAHPWLEIASDRQAHLAHPPTRVALDERVPGFWYNPASGIVRARVPQTASDERAVELYNEINGADIGTLIAPTGW